MSGRKKRISEWAGPNYLKSYSHSRKLARTIVEYYENHPSFSKDFVRQISVTVETNPVTEVHEVRSNLDDLMANWVDVEERYY